MQPSVPPLPAAAPSAVVGIRNPGAARLFLVALVFVMLLVGLGLVGGLVEDRLLQAREAGASVAASWGPPQVLAGPVLVIPGTRRRQVVDQGVTREVVEEVRHVVLPARHEVDAELAVEQRRRGIFPVDVFTAAVKGGATFDEVDLAGSAGVTWRRDEAFLELELSDPRAILPGAAATWKGKPLVMRAAAKREGSAGPVVELRGEGLAEGGGLEFGLRVAFTGSFVVAPLGEETVIGMRSTFPDPSFQGVRLPSERRVDGAGFESSWQLGGWARGMPASWIERTPTSLAERLGEGGVGVTLRRAVDVHRLAERAIRYGILFLVVGMGGLAILDFRSGFALGPMAYPCGGAALVLFFLTLLAAAEHVPFGVAYAAASGVEFAVLAWFLAGTGLGARGVAGLLGALGVGHAYLYFVLRLEEHALLAGSLVFWLLLVAVMALVRKQPGLAAARAA